MSGTHGAGASAPGSAASLRQQAAQQVLTACQQAFQPPAFEVVADDTGVVWVRRLGKAPRSIGLQPWLLRNKTVEELVARVESKLGDDSATAC